MIINDNELVFRLEEQILRLERIANVAQSGAGSSRSVENGINECRNLLSAIYDLRRGIKHYDDAYNAAIATDSDRIEDACRVLEECKHKAEKCALDLANLLAIWLTRYDFNVGAEARKSDEESHFLVAFDEKHNAKHVFLFIDQHKMLAEGRCQ